MRRKIYTMRVVRGFAISALFIGICMCVYPVCAEEIKLNISAPDEIQEDDTFTVSVYIFNETNEVHYLSDVSIIFNGNKYLISEENENYEITLTSPIVDSDKSLNIAASKDGYLLGLKQITVKNVIKYLVIVPQSIIVAPNEEFYVTVYENDKNGEIVQGAIVYISNGEGNQITDNNGNAFFTVPDDGRTEIKIHASKEDYETGTMNIRIQTQMNLLMDIINKYLIVIISVIILLSAVLIVHYRQKRSIYIRAKEISSQKFINKYSTDKNPSDSPDKRIHYQEAFAGSPVRIYQDEDSKIEEIRISRPYNDKKIVGVKTEDDETEKKEKKKNNQKRDNNWFEGMDEFRYEINKITGEIDEEGRDKWFEGMDDIKKQINERIKKKKQNEEKK